MRGLTINQPIYEQDLQWRLKIQPFTKGGFEAKAVLDQSLFITDRNAAMIFFRYLPNENNPLPTPF